MRRPAIVLVLVLSLVSWLPVLAPLASALAQRGFGYRSWLRGNAANVDVAVHSGAMLDGGAKDLRGAWPWFLQRAGYGDIVLICSTYTAEYNPYVMRLSSLAS